MGTSREAGAKQTDSESSGRAVRPVCHISFSKFYRIFPVWSETAAPATVIHRRGNKSTNNQAIPSHRGEIVLIGNISHVREQRTQRIIRSCKRHTNSEVCVNTCITRSSNHLFAVFIWNVLPRFRVTKSLAQPHIDDVQDVRGGLVQTHQKVVLKIQV